MVKYFDLREQIDDEKINEAVKIIKQGGIVLFPTETVYGIGGNGLDYNAVEKVYDAKGRKRENPINLLVCDIQMVEKITKNITPLEYKLMENFFPGPFTIILKKDSIVPDIVTANGDTVGIRMPSGEIAKKLVEYSEVPIAAPSANLSGMPSGTNIEDILDEFKDKVDCIINGGESDIGIESTIVRVVDEIPHVLRPGAITNKQIEEVTGAIILDYQNVDNNMKLLPSKGYKHYTTKSKGIVVYSQDKQKQILKIIELASNYKNPIIICCDENVNSYCNIQTINVGSRENLLEISKNIFKALRQADKEKPDLIIIEGVQRVDIGIAIMDRLIKSCNNNYIEI